MPPEISAGMPGLGTAPDTVITGKPGAGPPVSDLSAILFAAFLTQSALPNPKALPRQAPAPKLTPLPAPLSVPMLNAKMPASPILAGTIRVKAKTTKTMDTLPQPLLVTEKPKANAGELPLSQMTAGAPSAILPLTTAPIQASSQASNIAPSVLPFVPVASGPPRSPSAAPAPASKLPPLPVSMPVPEAASPSPSQAAPLQAMPLQAPPHYAPRHGGPVVADIFIEQGGTPPQASSMRPQASPALTPLGRRSTAVSAMPSVLKAPTGQTLTAPDAAASRVAAMTPSVPVPRAPFASQPIHPVAAEVIARSLPHAGTAAQVVPAPAVRSADLFGQSQTTRLIKPETSDSAVPLLPRAAALAAAPASADAAPSILAPAIAEPAEMKAVGTKAAGTKAADRSPQITLKTATGNADINTSTRSAPILPVMSSAASERTAMPVTVRETAAPVAETAAAKEALVPLKTLEASLTPGMPAFSAAPQTAAPETKPLTAPERAAIVRQAADSIGAIPLPVKPGAAQQMSVQLHPKDWGSLQVSVSITPGQDAGSAKTVTAHIVAETPQVKAALQSATGALHQALKASGLHLEHLTVSVKPAEIKTFENKTTEVKPAAQSASAGMSSGQGQPSQSQSNAYGQPAASSQMNSQLGAGAGGSQNGRQGQPQSAHTAPLVEPEESLSAALPLRTGATRIDMHA